MNNDNYLGSELNPVHSNYELRKAMIGRKNCIIYTVGTFKLDDDNLYMIKVKNIKLVGMLFNRLEYKPSTKKKHSKQKINIVVDEIHSLDFDIKLEQRSRYINGGMH